MMRESLWVSIVRRLLAQLPNRRPAPPAWPAVVQHAALALEFPESLAALEDEPARTPAPADAAAPDAIASVVYAAANRESAMAAFRQHGFESIAFYAPISFYGPKRWGIYFNERNLWGVVAECAQLLGMASSSSLATEILYVVDQHERFHASIELLALVVDDHRHLPRASVSDADEDVARGFIEPSSLAYRHYHSAVYQPSWPREACLEESLATAFQFRRRLRFAGLRRTLERLTSVAPPAYAQWRKYGGANDFADAHHELASAVVASVAQWNAERGAAGLQGRPKPQLWLPSSEDDALRAVGPIPRYVWRSDTRTPTLFSASLLGNVRTRDIVGCMRSKFGAVLRDGGRHPAVTFPNGRKVPYSTSWDTVPRFFLGQLAEAVGVEREQLVRACI